MPNTRRGTNQRFRTPRSPNLRYRVFPIRMTIQRNLVSIPECVPYWPPASVAAGAPELRITDKLLTHRSATGMAAEVFVGT